MTGEDFGFTSSAKPDKGSSSSRGTGGTRRTNVFIKGEYGTEVFPPDTECEYCSKKAIGVLKVTPDDASDKESHYEPLCTRHREQEEKEIEYDWATTEFKKFA